MNNNLPPGVLMTDIDGPPMLRCTICLLEFSGDDGDAVCEDCRDKMKDGDN